MPDDPTQEQPTAEPAAGQASAAAPSPEPASRQPSPLRPFSLARAIGADPVAPASDGDPPAAEPAPASSTDDKPAPPKKEASKPSEPATAEQPSETPQPSRRAQREHENVTRIRELEAEIATLKTATPADPDAEREAAIAAAVEQARADERARIEREREAATTRETQEALARRSREDAERFEAACRMPDSDPRLGETVPGTDQTLYEWREAQKERLVHYPEVERHYQAVAEQRIEQARAQDRAELSALQDKFWADVAKELDGVVGLPGVDKTALGKAASFAERERLIHAGGAASRDAEVAALTEKLDKATQTIAQQEDDIRDLKLGGPRGLAARRSPVEGGRSGAAETGPRAFDETRGWRQNLTAALTAPSNGAS